MKILEPKRFKDQKKNSQENLIYFEGTHCRKSLSSQSYKSFKVKASYFQQKSTYLGRLN